MVAHVNRTSHRRPGRMLVLAAVTPALALGLAAPAFAGPSPVLLRTAGSYAVLGGSGMANTGTTTISGDIGSSPTHTEAGFVPCPAVDCVSLTGTNHDDADPNDAVTQQAKADLLVAYDDAFARTGGAAIVAPLGGGQTLVSGVYTSAVNIFVGGDLTLDAGGDPNAVFIFQARTGTLVTAAGISGGVPNTRVLLTNGAQACNVFWQVGTSATIDTYTQFVGNIMSNQSTTLNTGATLDGGRALALNGSVTLDTNVLRQATCATPPPAGGGTTTTSPTPTGTPSPPAPGTGATPVATPLRARPAPAGTARISGPGRSVTGPFRVTVTGRRIAKVAFYVDGKRVSTVRAKAGRTNFTVTIDPRRQSGRVHRVTARVTYKAGSRTRSTTRRVTYRGPTAPRSPRFTG
jgi:ice-binding like protein